MHVVAFRLEEVKLVAVAESKCNPTNVEYRNAILFLSSGSHAGGLDSDGMNDHAVIGARFWE